MAPRTARRVTVYVHVTNPDTAESVVLAPGDEVPNWASKLVTNPKAFAGDAAATAGSTSSSTPAATAGTEGKPLTAAQKKAAAKKDAEAKAAAEAEAAARAAAEASGADDTDPEDDDTSSDDGDDGDEPPTFNP
jgi:hypothetical protein